MAAGGYPNYSGSFISPRNTKAQVKKNKNLKKPKSNKKRK